MQSPFTAQILSSGSYRQMAWKNGGGLTQEICRYPKGKEVFDWRVSIASVNKAGDFSLFEGYHRIISILKGDGIYLLHDQSEKKLIQQKDVSNFPGDQPIHCQLVNGPVIDFNLIYDPALYKAQLQWVQPETTLVSFTTSATHVLLFSNAASSKVEVNNSLQKDLSENDTLWIANTTETTANISVTMSAPVILIELCRIK
jgi:uncharacterized protein